MFDVMRVFFVVFVFGYLLCGCVRKESELIRCPIGIMYITENDKETISDLLVDEILEYNIYCEGGD